MSTGPVTWTACSNAGRFGRWLSTASLLSFTTRGFPRGALQGLNPDAWFGNVEFVVAREMGQETVRYVSNIYKYDVAYQLVLEQSELREKEVRANKGTRDH
jgi:hypothetical protein